MDWSRDDAGQWAADVDGGRYVIRGGPGSWWFELVNPRGALLATGRMWGSPAEAQAEARDRVKMSSAPALPQESPGASPYSPGRADLPASPLDEDQHLGRGDRA